MTLNELRAAVERLIARGQLVNPQQIRLAEPHLILDVDEHLSDEAIAGGRLRIALRSPRELRLIAEALEELERP